MAISFPVFKSLGASDDGQPSCEPGDLIRLKLGGSIRWGLVGKESGSGLLPILTFGARGVARLSNANDTPYRSRTRRDAVLCYGRALVLPDLTEQCAIGEGEVFSENGSMIISGADRYICAEFPGMAYNPGYLNLDTWEALSQPGGSVAGFRHWSVFLDGHPTYAKTPLVQYEAAPLQQVTDLSQYVQVR